MRNRKEERAQKKKKKKKKNSHLLNSTVRMQNVNSFVCLFILLTGSINETLSTNGHENIILLINEIQQSVSAV